jgi:hypothetical protein
MRDSSYVIDQLSGRLAATHQGSVAREMFVGLKALGARFTLTICLLFGMVNVCTAQANTSPSQIRDHRTASASDQREVRDHRRSETPVSLKANQRLMLTNGNYVERLADGSVHIVGMNGRVVKTFPQGKIVQDKSGGISIISGKQRVQAGAFKAIEAAVLRRDHRTESASDQIVAPNNRSGTTQDHGTARTSENETSFDEADATFGRRTSLAAADETGDQRTITDEEKARIDKLTEAHRVTTTSRPAPLSPKPTKKTAPGDFPDSDSNPRPPTGPVPIPYPNIPSSTDGSAEKKKAPISESPVTKD